MNSKLGKFNLLITLKKKKRYLDKFQTGQFLPPVHLNKYKGLNFHCKWYIRTITTTLTEFLTEILGHDTGTVFITAEARVVTGLVIMYHLTAVVILLQLNLATMHGPQPIT